MFTHVYPDNTSMFTHVYPDNTSMFTHVYPDNTLTCKVLSPLSIHCCGLSLLPFHILIFSLKSQDQMKFNLAEI
jgi:hypothetical protein